MINPLKNRVLNVITTVGDITEFSYLVLLGLKNRKLRLRLLLEQMVYVGVQSIPIVVVTAAFVGMAFTIQVVREFLSFGAGDMIGGIVGLAIWRELGPMMTGTVIAGRIGAAISAELGTMKVTEQVEALETMSQDPLHYLALPRIIGLTLMMPLLVGLADLVGFFSGWFIALSTGQINPVSYFQSAQNMLFLSDINGGLIKALVFGFSTGVIGCYMGLKTEAGARGVGKSTMNSVVYSLISVFILNYFFSLILFN